LTKLYDKNQFITTVTTGFYGKIFYSRAYKNGKLFAKKIFTKNF